MLQRIEIAFGVCCYVAKSGACCTVLIKNIDTFYLNHRMVFVVRLYDSLWLRQRCSSHTLAVLSVSSLM